MILARAKQLDILPERGRTVPELRPRVVREVYVARYRLFYEVTASETVIIGVLDAARDFVRWVQERGEP